MRSIFVLLLATAFAWADEPPPNYNDPNQLLRAARDLRLDLGDLGPVRFSGGGTFGPGSPAAFMQSDLRKLNYEVSLYERACLHIQDARDTRPQFERVDEAFQRAWRAQPYGTPSARDIPKIIGRLRAFYASMPPSESPSPVSPPPED